MPLPQLPPPPQSPPAAEAGDATLREKYASAARAFKAGDRASALVLFRELAQQDKSFFKYVGACAFSLGEYTEAAAALEQAAELEPSDFALRKMLALAYFRLDDPGRGIVHAAAGLALREDPELRQLHDKLGRDRTAQEDYVQESSSHFTALYDGYEHGRIDREVLGILEDAYAAIGTDLGVYPPGRTTVILYSDRDFFDTTRAPSWSGGIYDGKIRIPIRGALDNRQQLRQVLFHEYAHAAVHAVAPGVPVWLNEGLADYFSRTYPRRCGQVIPLTLLEKSFLGLKDERAAAAYLESFSAVSYLMETYGRHRMRLLLESLGRSRDVHRAFPEAFGITYGDFLSQWGKK